MPVLATKSFITANDFAAIFQINSIIFAKILIDVKQAIITRKC